MTQTSSIVSASYSRFWYLIDTSRKDAQGNYVKQCQILISILEEEDIVTFHKIFSNACYL